MTGTGTYTEPLKPALDTLLASKWKTCSLTEKWDCGTGARIVAVVEETLDRSPD